MQAKNEPGGRHRIAHLLSRAFREAEAGDRESAMAYWHQAMAEGYEPKVKTKKQLMFTLRLAEQGVGQATQAQPRPPRGQRAKGGKQAQPRSFLDTDPSDAGL